MKIQSISEAFSQQPTCLYIGMTWFLEDKTTTKVYTIKLEKVNHPIHGDPMMYDYYVGYDVEGRKLFQYMANTVNVHYF